MAAISLEDLKLVKPFTYEEEIHRFGLLKNGFIVLTFEDSKVKGQNVDRIPDLCGGELVRVHAIEQRTMIKVLSGESHYASNAKINSATEGRMSRVSVSGNFPVKIAEGVEMVSRFTRRQSVLISKGSTEPLKGLDRVNRADKRAIATIFHADEYLCELDIVQTLIPMASPFR